MKVKQEIKADRQDPNNNLIFPYSVMYSNDISEGAKILFITLQILQNDRGNTIYIKDIAKFMNKPAQTIKNHLAELKKNGNLESKKSRQGMKFKLYFIENI